MSKGSDICPDDLRDEAGVSLVEIIVAATMLVIVTIGVFGALEAAGRAGAEERYRSQAYQVAQGDQARLRTLKVTALTNLDQTRTITQDGTPYTVRSISQFTTDSTGTQSCDTGTASADYLRIGTTVTWPSIGTRPAVTISSIIAPPNGSFAEDRGALAVAVRNAAGIGIPSISLSGTGAGTFNGATGTNGCAVFVNLPEGNYTLAPSASGYVDKDGIAAGPVPTSVVSQTTNSVALQLDRPGSIETTFQTRLVSNGPLVTSNADTVMVDNTGMTAAKSFGTVGNRVLKITSSSLFPFTSPDLVYAGACEGNNPVNVTPLAAEAADSVQVNAGGPVATASVVLPALNLTVRSGTGPGTSTQGSLVNNARVTLTDRNCSSPTGVPIKRVFATNSSGKLTDPGVPYSAYDVCVSNTSTGTGNPPTIRRVQTNNLAIKSSAIPANLTVYLSATGVISGACP